MTIDEAIENLEYNTKQLEMEIESGLWIKGSESELCCKEGIALNKQLIELLTELKELKELKAAGCASVRRGHWDYSEKEYGECEWYFCSECDSPAEQLYNDNALLSEFCPHCGADMRGDENA